MKFKAKVNDCQLTVTVSYDSTDEINRNEFVFFQTRCPRGFMKISQEKKRKIEYIGPRAVSLYDRLKTPVAADDFFMIIEQVVYSTMVLQKNDLMWNKVVWDLKNVYINQNTKELQLIYLPFAKGGTSNILEFLNSIAYMALPEDKGADYISKFSFFIRGLQWYDPKAVENYVVSQNSKCVSIVNSVGLGGSGFMTDKPIDYYSHYGTRNDDDDEATGLLVDDEDEATGLLNEDEYETALLVDDSADEGTMLLSEDLNTPKPVLHRLSNDERITLSKSVFRLGKDGANVDYCVMNNAVSRKHADFITRDENVFVMDLGSKNGTFVNGMMISAQTETLVSYGDMVKLGNEEFILEEG